MPNRHPLAVLIDDVCEANDLSLQDVADRATRAGHKLSKQTVSRVHNDPVITVGLNQVNALAAGLGVPRSLVARAALASMGIIDDTSEQWTVEMAVQRDPGLSTRQKKTLLSLLEAMRTDKGSASFKPGNKHYRRGRNGGNPKDPHPGKTGRVASVTALAAGAVTLLEPVASVVAPLLSQ